jgi:hypothetical protein
MVSVLADNLEIERCLRRIMALSEAAGAEFSHDLVIKCVDGHLSIEAPPEGAGKLLMRLPWDCLVPLPHFRLGIVGDKFVISWHEPELTGTCIATMEAMLDLYNLTNKLAVHRLTSPWSLAASHPELLPTLMAGRRARHRSLVASGNRDDLDLQSFFHTRAYSYRDTLGGPTLPVLMPILDAMNHHSMGAPYLFGDQPESGPLLVMTRSIPLPGTGNECFARYSIQDCFDGWMGYGFIDETPTFLRSLAMQIDLPDWGTIRTADVFSPRTKQDLPLSVSDLHFYIPKLLARRRNQIDTASVLVPGPQAPRALRRTLHFLIAELNPDRPTSRDLVANAEQQVIAANTAYYQALAAFLRAMPLGDGLQRPILDKFIRMCDLQLGRLSDYANYAEG